MIIKGMIITKTSNSTPSVITRNQCNNKKLITKVNTSAVRRIKERIKETGSVSFTPSGEQRWQDPWGRRSGPWCAAA